MREYKWEEGRWLTDGHNWCMLLDIPKLPRVDTGERVTLQPPRFVHIEVPPVECKICYVPDANIYIAIADNAFKDCPVLFYDMISLSAEQRRRFPDIKWEGEQEPYEAYHNRMRKVWALKKCVSALEDLQERYPPIFNSDPMVAGYLEQLRTDIANLETLSEDEKANSNGTRKIVQAMREQYKKENSHEEE